MLRTVHVFILTASLALTACGGETNAVGESTKSSSTAMSPTSESQPPSGDASGPHPGEKIYEQYCFSCHTPGLSGAPKLGDKEAWAPRIAKGQALLLTTTIEGIVPAMPPKGLCRSCSDEELAQVVDFMVKKSQ
ncbi:MAG: c-type cytochrome [Pseudomonadota bacterium]